jgi:meso-butanediol dehydrogenase/(S,S)-butanediol dehydrogenase/diacetyl reductase
MTRFAGKTVLVTGAASGIGLATVRRFVEEGANVVAVDLAQADLEKAVAGLPQERVLVHAADTSSAAAAQVAVAAATERFGALDVLVNNAGIASQGDIEQTSEEDFDRVIAVNVGGYYHMARAAIPALRAATGAIVMTSSVSGLGGDWNMFAYNTSKGAVSNMVRALAMDSAKFGVRVNAVNPSFTATGMTDDMMEDEELLAKFRERMPLGAPAQPDDIAAVITFLASDDARFVTGVNLPVDGGLMASNGQPPQ